MKNYKERTESVLEKVKLKKAKRRNAVMAGVTSFALAALIATNAVWLMPNSPFRVNENNTPPITDNGGADNENGGGNYTPPSIILPPNQNSSTVLQAAGSYSNVYKKIEAYSQSSSGGNGSGESAEDGFDGSAGVEGDGSGASGENPNSYQEVTNNQVDGVIEADLFKRSDEHIFYLTYGDYGYVLNAYSIEGESSKIVAEYSITLDDEFNTSQWFGMAEMYLSKDAKTITVLIPCRYNYKEYYYLNYTAIVSIDASDVYNIKENKRVYISGSYASSRLTEEGLLLATNFSARLTDKDDTVLYIPHTVYGNERVFVEPSRVLMPKNLSSTTQTYISLLNAENLQIISDTALLSYTSDIYVSKDNLYVTRGYYPYYAKEIEGDYHVVRSRKTDIARIDYSGGGLELKGSITLEGYIDDQYSMDEKDGVLRVFTSTQADIYSNAQNKFVEITESASLYCIDVQSFEVLKSVENFAPYGENVRSARFDGDTAYVCTAVQFTDPVFAFDLSDYNNITYTDTGTIDGYSISLIQFYGDTLLGIGYGDSSSDLKIEVYNQGDTTFESVDKFEKERTYFSSNFKSYYINAEKGLVGLATQTYDYSNNNRVNIKNYILFKFDGKNLIEAVIYTVEGDYTYSRSTIIDEYLYVLTDKDFIVINVAEHL